MNELNILKWAAGNTKPLLPIEDIDEDLLLEATYVHRLEGRLLRRLKLETQPWSRQSTLDELEARQLTNITRAKKQLDVIKEIQREFSTSGQTMILIKGYSPYFILRDPASLRFSWDVDILSGDSFQMQEALSRLGYYWNPNSTVEAHHNPRAFRHDLDFSVDSYNYIPVWSYPQDITPEDLDPATNPGMWNQVIEPVHNEIHVEDLIEHSLTDPRSEAGPLIIPDATMTVLIICAQLFTDFLQGLPGRYGRLHLGRLAEIKELCKHPKFDIDTFIVLVRKFEALDAVRFTAALLAHYVGYDAFSSVLFIDHNQQYWRRFYRSSFWLPAPNSYDELLMQPDAAESLRYLLFDVGANEVLVADYDRGPIYWTEGEEKGIPLRRVITRNIKETRLPVAVKFRRNEESLLMDVMVVGRPNPEDLVSLEFGGVPCYWLIGRGGLDTEEGTSFGNYKNVVVTFNSMGYTLQVEFPIAMLQSIDTKPFPVLLAVMRLADGCTSRPTMGKLSAGTLIPMYLVNREGNSGLLKNNSVRSDTTLM